MVRENPPGIRYDGPMFTFEDTEIPPPDGDTILTDHIRQILHAGPCRDLRVAGDKLFSLGTDAALKGVSL